jgi:asparagine synthase (glutamine-hydrolysing)
MKIKNGLSKYLLREAARPFIPSEIAYRRDKMGYVTPNNKWITELRTSLLPYFDQDMKGIIRKDKLLADYNSFFDVAGKPENGRVFKFAAFAVWRKVTGI